MVAKVSVVMPCRNQAGTVWQMHARLREIFSELEITAELIFIDDGSIDATRETLRKLADNDPDCRVIVFRRSYGTASALQAGLALAQGDYILLPGTGRPDELAEIPPLLEALQQADVVCGWQRHADPVLPLPARWSNAVARRVAGARLHDFHCPLRGYRREVIHEIPLSTQQVRYLPILAIARGFRVVEMTIAPQGSLDDYNWDTFLYNLYDLIGLAYQLKYRAHPLRLFGGLGLGFTLFGLALGAVLSPSLTVFAPPPAWHFFMWLLALAFVILGPVFIGLGVLAEGHTAGSADAQPPIAERLNCDQITEHSGR